MTVNGNDNLEGPLRTWWMDTAAVEVEKVVPKAVEYGADDLIYIGQELGLLLGRSPSDEEAAELGIYFYELGKMARWRSAIRRGDRVSDDTLHDIGVYIRMAQRVRAVGGWPFAPGMEADSDHAE